MRDKENMRNIKAAFFGIAAFACLLGAAWEAGAQSMGFLMPEADLVVVGDVIKMGERGRIAVYSLHNTEVIRGDAGASTGASGGRSNGATGGFADGITGKYATGMTAGVTDFDVVLFRDVGLPVALRDGERTLLFLRRLMRGAAGLDPMVRAYTPLAGELGVVVVTRDREGVILDAARRYAALEGMEPEAKAAAVAGIFRTALEAGAGPAVAPAIAADAFSVMEPLLYSAAFDLMATPGALEKTGSYEAALALRRLRAAPAMSRVRGRLIHLLGEMATPGLPGELESIVRSAEGMFYLDPAAAILAHIDDPATPQRLAAGFLELSARAKENVIYVLGNLGEGRGVPMLHSLLWENMEDFYKSLIHALRADHSESAVMVLSEVAQKAQAAAACLALETLAQINTHAARTQIGTIAEMEGLDPTVSDMAAALLADLSR